MFFTDCLSRGGGGQWDMYPKITTYGWNKAFSVWLPLFLSEEVKSCVRDFLVDWFIEDICIGLYNQLITDYIVGIDRIID